MDHVRPAQEQPQNLIQQVAELIGLATYCRSTSVETAHSPHQRNTSRSSQQIGPGKTRFSPSLGRLIGNPAAIPVGTCVTPHAWECRSAWLCTSSSWSVRDNIRIHCPALVFCGNHNI